MNTKLYLRLVQFEDEAEEIFELFCVPEVYEYLADGRQPPPSIAGEWVRQSIEDYLLFGGGLWALQAEGCSSLLGLVRLSDLDARSAELTYLLHPGAWGRGYASRMSNAAIGRAFEIGLATTVWAGADVANRRSIAVMERLGMTLRARVHYPAGPGVEYAMTSSESDPRRFEPIPLWTGEAGTEWCA